MMYTTFGLLPIAQLVMMSRTFETMQLEFQPEKFQLTAYEQDVMPALIARLVDGLGFERARPRFRLGSVASFDVTPFMRADPTVILCARMDLKKYYEMWGLMMRADHWRLRDMFVEYDVAMQIAK